MILIISTIICIALIIAAIYHKNDFLLTLLIIPIGFGYGLLGLAVTVDTKTEHKVVSSICSAELGKCKLIVDNTIYEVDNYTVVDWFVNNPRECPYLFIMDLNSYGGYTDIKIQLPNKYIYKAYSN